MNSEPLAPPSMMYRFSIPCRRLPPDGGSGPRALEATYSLPDIGQLNRLPTAGQLGERSVTAAIDQRQTGASFADVRVAWDESGLAIDVTVDGKQQSLWCRKTQMLASDRVMVWVDTRDTHNVHRATRFCHWFLALPTEGSGGEATSSMLRVNRAREDPPTLNQRVPPIRSELSERGYRLQLRIPGDCLTGWNPLEYTKLGFNYAVVDRELGWQSLGCGPEWPIDEDPSLWQTLELIDAD